METGIKRLTIYGIFGMTFGVILGIIVASCLSAFQYYVLCLTIDTDGKVPISQVAALQWKKSEPQRTEKMILIVGSTAVVGAALGSLIAWRRNYRTELTPYGNLRHPK